MMGHTDLSYELIERQIVVCLPWLEPAAARYWQDNGQPGSDPGPYIFFNTLVKCLIEILLDMRDSDARNGVLKDAFCLVDAMLSSNDKDVRDLAYIEVLENADQVFLHHALPFFGGSARLELDRWQSGWRELALSAPAFLLEQKTEVIDLYNVRDAVMEELKRRSG